MKDVFPKGRIAVVGNGPTELGKGRGAEIDAHDAVIRFNNFEISGHEADYGTRTTHVCSNMMWDIRPRNMDLFERVYVPYPANDPEWLRDPRGINLSKWRNAARVEEAAGKITYMSSAIWYELAGMVECRASTGLALVYWLWRVKRLDDCDLYGFSHFFTGEQRHYFDNEGEDSHQGLLERFLIGGMKSCRPWW